MQPGSGDTPVTWANNSDISVVSLLVDRFNGRIRDSSGTGIIVGGFVRLGAGDLVSTWPAVTGTTSGYVAGGSDEPVSWNAA